MKVLLKQDVKGVGTAGQIKDVADGYARNFLIPRRLAEPATPEVLRQAEARRAADAKRTSEEERRLHGLADEMAAEPLVIQARVGEKDRLYGSITSADVAEALERRHGRTFDKRRIELKEPIRTAGGHRVEIRLHPNVVATVTVEVRPEEE